MSLKAVSLHKGDSGAAVEQTVTPLVVPTLLGGAPASRYRRIFPRRHAEVEVAEMQLDGRAGGEPPIRPEAPLCDAVYRSAAAHIGKVIAGKYLIRSLLGRGGMGFVFEAEHVELRTVVAIKLMRPDVAAVLGCERRLRYEAIAASRMNHPNIVRILDAGASDQGYFIAMERLRGPTLRASLAGRSELFGLDVVGKICHELLSALDSAHRCGVVHRDIKPENLILAVDDSGNEGVKVIDFGVAHHSERDGGDTLPSVGLLGGTPEYMSPEQCRAEAVTPSTDLYAVGCVLTELLQGRAPFTGASPLDTMMMHTVSSPPPLARPPGAELVPRELEALRCALLAKWPIERPTDAAEACGWLTRALARHRPIVNAAGAAPVQSGCRSGLG